MFPCQSLGEDQDLSSSVQVESIYDDFEEEKKKERERKNKIKREKKKGIDKYKKVSDLVYLSSFRDLAVIQKRYFPKTNRFEFSTGGAINLKNSLFNNMGGAFRLGYFLNENFGLEASYFYLSSFDKELIKRLKNKGQFIERLVNPEHYIGGSFKWIPIYGKMALLNKSIVPFDIHFSFDLGRTITVDNRGGFTMGGGVGQIFPFSRSIAFRWDFSWHVYKPGIKVNETGAVIQSDESQGREIGYHNDLFFSMGLSFFFPKAKYR